MNILNLNKSITRFLLEDIGSEDITTNSIVSEDLNSSADFIAKEDGIVCGLNLLLLVFKQLSNKIEIILHKNDGDKVSKNDILATIIGNTRAILTGERVALNIIQRMSGISTTTRVCVDKVKSLDCSVLDTRKTIPGFREFDKYAVRIGGASNHRFDLGTTFMIKDNHILAAGSITKAIASVHGYKKPMCKIEIEVDNLQQLQEVLANKVDIILLDNMSYDMLKEAVSMCRKTNLWLEASGGITPENIFDYAKTGVNAVSLGFLTHSVKALDISLDFKI